jgi:hypothetical protein
MSESGISVRRWFVILAPLVAGLLAVIGSVADPASGKEGAELYRLYGAEPGRVQLKSVAYHFSYALWAASVFPLIGLVRGRGVGWANLAGLCAILGISTLPGFLLADFYDSAITQRFGTEGALQVEQTMRGMWAVAVMVGSGIPTFMLSLPLAAVAARRAGLLPWWAPVSVLVGILAFAVSATVRGTVVLAAAFAVFSFAIWRMDRGVWTAPPAQESTS